MRIRVFRAFASNNSGSYTLVGGFRSAEDAEEAAAFLSDLCERETKWREGDVQTPPSPLDEAATALGLEPPGAEWDDWPDTSYAVPPSVVRIDCQVLVHVAYTASMPRVLGAMMYAKRGRVELELNHSHDRLAAELQFWVRDDKTAKLEAVRAAVDAVLPELTAPDPGDESGAIVPAWHPGESGDMNLSVVFRDLAEGVLVVRAIAAREGVRVFLKIREVYANDPDPFAVLRGAAGRPPGVHETLPRALSRDLSSARGHGRAGHPPFGGDDGKSSQHPSKVTLMANEGVASRDIPIGHHDDAPVRLVGHVGVALARTKKRCSSPEDSNDEPASA